MPSSVLAQTVATSAMEPLVIHILVPLRIQSASSPEPDRRAVVRIEPGSEPASGSVSPKQPIASPRAIRGSHSCFCSSLPYFQIEYMASEPCTLTSERSPESTASTSAQAMRILAGQRAGAVVALQMHAEQAQLAELQREIAGRQRAGLEPLGDVGSQLLVGEAAHGVAQQLVLAGQGIVQVEQIQAVQGVEVGDR